MKSPKEIGEALKGARHKKGFTLDTIYKTTHIQPRTVEALEDGKADSILTKIYVLLFLKKYAAFLDLDGESLAAQYKSFYDNEPEKPKLELQKDPLAINARAFKWAWSEVSATLVFLVIFFILLFGIKLRYSRPVRNEITPSTVVTAGPVRAKPKPRTAHTIFPIPEDKSVEVSLRCANDAWMKVKEDGSVVFEGIIGKNGRKSWSANETVELWVGRAEAVDFTVNGKRIGKVGEGKVRSILFSRSGLQIEGKWLFRAEK